MNWLNYSNKIKYIFGILMLTVLFSCVSDDLAIKGDDVEGPAQLGSARRYAAFKINNLSGASSRATGNVFEDGSPEEYAVYLDYPETETPHVLMIFDGNGKNLAPSDVQTENQINVIPLKLELPTDDTEDEGEENGEDEEDPSEEPEEEVNGPITSTYNYLYAEVPPEVANGAQETGIFLTVVNASPELIKKLQKPSTGTSAQGTTSSDYEKILSLLQTYGTESDFYVVDKKGVKYHTMTSSMVVNDDKKKVPATEGSLKFWNTPEKARDFPYTLYVERMLAKYTVLFQDPNSQNNYIYLVEKLDEPSKEKDPENPEEQLESHAEQSGNATAPAVKLFYTLPETKNVRYVTSYTRRPTIDSKGTLNVQEGKVKVNITGWGINNFEKKEYLFKNFNPAATEEKDYFSGWQDPNAYRVYWAEDPHYSTDYYPDQYRPAYKFNENNQLEYNRSIRDYESMFNRITTENPLTCFSYSALSNKNTVAYVPENTFKAGLSDKEDGPLYTYESKSYLRVSSHLIVTAQMLIEGFEYASPTNVFNSEEVNSEGLVNNVRSKYFMNGIYWTEDAYKEYVAEYLGYFMLTQYNTKPEKFGPNDGYFYINTEGGVANRYSFTLARAEIEGGDATVYLKPLVKLYVKNPDIPEDGEISPYKLIYDPDDENGPDRYTTLAYQHTELMAKCFNEGRMYYVAPTSHGPSELLNIPTGKYGTVRNWWYNFKIQGFSGVGTPVSEKLEAIVPNNLHEENAVNLKMEILSWHGENEEVGINGQKPSGSND